MRAWSGAKRALAIWMLGLGAGALQTGLHAQEIRSAVRTLVGIGSIVSVVDLRISEKAWLHFDKAKALAEHNRLAEAELETGKAIALAPRFAGAYLLRASVLVQKQRFEDALASLAVARQIQPDALWEGLLTASACNGLHRYSEAKADLDGMHGREAESWQAAYERARVAVGLRNVDDALRWSAAALAGAPENFADARLLRANSLSLAHRWQEAASQMEMYLLFPGPQYHRAEVLTALEKTNLRLRAAESKELASR